MGQDDDETLHGFRSGCGITLALSGVELTVIIDHVGTRVHGFALLTTIHDTHNYIRK